MLRSHDRYEMNKGHSTSNLSRLEDALARYTEEARRKRNRTKEESNEKGARMSVEEATQRKEQQLVAAKTRKKGSRNRKLQETSQSTSSCCGETMNARGAVSEKSSRPKSNRKVSVPPEGSRYS